MLSVPLILATIVCGLIAVTIATLGSLTSLWAANPRASWLARATPISLFLGMQFPIGCFDFAFAFAVQALLVVGTFTVTKRSLAGRARFQAAERLEQNKSALQPSDRVRSFTLARMFLALLVAGVVFAMIASAPDEWGGVDWMGFYYWKDVLLAGLTLAMTTLMAWTLALSPTKRRIAIAGVVVAAPIVTARHNNYTWWFEYFLNADLAWPMAAILVVGHVVVLVSVLVLLKRSGWAWWGAMPEIPDTEPLPGRTRWRIALGLLASLLVLPALDLFRALIPPGAPPPVQTIEPNGRVELLKVLKQLRWSSIPNRDFAAASLSQQETFLRENAAILAAMRTSLDLPTLKPFDARDVESILGNTELSEISYLFEGCGKHAEAIGDLKQAVQCYINILQLGQSFRRGGLPTDDTYASGIEDSGVRGLVPLLKRVDSATLARLQCQTRAVQLAVEPVENFLERERSYDQFSLGYSGRIVAWLSSWRLYGAVYMDERLPIVRAQRNALLELLITECAIERYSRDHSVPPAKLAALVPDYLPAVPLDPFDEQPLRYRQTDSGHLLYSIGRNDTDDGGVSSTQTGLEGDLLLEP